MKELVGSKDHLAIFETKIFDIPMTQRVSFSYLSLGGDDVDLVDPSERASVDAEGTGDEQQTRGQLLQEHHALSLVDAGHEDQDGAGSDRRAQLAAVINEVQRHE